MSERVEQMFSQLRRGPWNADPMGVPQEGFGGNGNVESQGWLSDGSVTADVIQANAVIAGKVDADAITAREIAANTITAAEIAANTITAAQIAANTITAAQIAANTVTAAQIAASTITSNEIAANTITAGDIAANTITAAQIAADTITASQIAADSITTNELAANAVITENVLAANITSSRIELTISGKNLGANFGTAAAPGIFFDGDTDTGISGGVGYIDMSLAGTNMYRHNSTGLNIWSHFLPGVSTINIGASTARWSTVYCVTLDQSSDANLKRDIADAPLGLDFVRTLRPRVFRWRETADTQAGMAAEAAFDPDAMAREADPHVRRIESIRQRQLAGLLSDQDAESDVAEERAAIDAISKRHVSPVDNAKSAKRPGRRLHYGLIAQEVKEALDAAGVASTEVGFWTESPDGEQSLSYLELMIPLLRAVQEMAVRLEAVEQRT